MHIRKYNLYVHHVYIWQMYHDMKIKTCGKHITTQAHTCILHLIIQ
jgi:hypothetical protein